MDKSNKQSKRKSPLTTISLVRYWLKNYGDIESLKKIDVADIIEFSSDEAFEEFSYNRTLEAGNRSSVSRTADMRDPAFFKTLS